jgi:branched-chain amino acid transport system ATP-binding protein
MLEVENLTVGYAAADVLHALSFRVAAGEIVALIGANGAGKTTTLRAISGLIRPRGGSIRFARTSIAGSAVEDIVRAGLVHCPEGRRIFPGLTVMENLRLGATAKRRTRAEMQDDFDNVFELFPRLRERRHQLGWSLSGGEQQMLAVGRALMARPRLLLLDEPSLGLAPLIVQQLFDKIALVNRRGVAILLVEQNAAMALDIAQRAYVLEMGRVVLADTAPVIRADPRVREAYLAG